ncbi:hypothetical protein vBEcoMWL3_gp069 [Escherichia phage vB_EcoM_WL-3]|nr:hypothetical protein vBEcoMWL3_gp069 [Escherichia phage vB_EcoM_WL-3]
MVGRFFSYFPSIITSTYLSISSCLISSNLYPVHNQMLLLG